MDNFPSKNNKKKNKIHSNERFQNNYLERNLIIENVEGSYKKINNITFSNKKKKSICNVKMKCVLRKEKKKKEKLPANVFYYLLIRCIRRKGKI